MEYLWGYLLILLSLLFHQWWSTFGHGEAGVAYVPLGHAVRAANKMQVEWRLKNGLYQANL